MIVYDKEQKEIVIPNGIGNINLFNNGVEAGYNQGKIDGINEQKSKLESINITENGTYSREDGYNHIEVNVPDLNVLTYAELKSLRDAGKLVAGTQYRITDYTCTTTQSGTKSAGYQFDIIVTADDESTLNEEARAALHTGDEYFSGCTLNAWKLWYCLDNDSDRFAWADATNGKGVIYRMIDEFNNDVPYDFKNIQFLRKFDSDKELWSTVPTDNTGVPCYTFSSRGNSATTSFTDMSLLASNRIYSNSIGKYVNNNKQTLNNNCFFGSGCYNNKFENNCYNNSFGSNCDGNSFGSSCYSNTFGSNCDGNSFGNSCNSNSFGSRCYSNSFGSRCYSNSFGSSCFRNTFGNYCYRNTFGSDCNSNIFGNNCYSNSFGSNCDGNSFGNDCWSITFGDSCNSNSFGNYCNSNSFVGGCNYNSFGNSCNSNSFGNYCNSNSFGNDCWSITFGDGCNYNSFGNYCNYNSFGNYCNSNSFGNDCHNIKFAPDSSVSTKYHFYKNNYFGDGCRYIVLTGAGTASYNQNVQNYNFAQGLQGTSSAYLTIDGKRNLTYETKVAKNSNGELKIYCEADLIL